MKKLLLSICTILALGFVSCGGGESGGSETYYNEGYNSGGSEITFKGGDKAVYVKGATCGESGCHCDGYMGTQTPSGRYKGKCINTDGWGHTCGHSPSDHGL